MQRRLFLLALVALVVVALGTWAYDRFLSQATTGPLPREVEGIPLVELQSGQEALKSINRLHGTSIEVVDGYVATYQKGAEKVQVWISRAASEEKARELVEIMTQKMQDNPVFEKPERFDIKGRTFYFTTGAGMQNYYWAQGTDVYWVGVVSPNEMKIIQKFISHPR